MIMLPALILIKASVESDLLAVFIFPRQFTVGAALYDLDKVLKLPPLTVIHTEFHV